MQLADADAVAQLAVASPQNRFSCATGVPQAVPLTTRCSYPRMQVSTTVARPPPKKTRSPVPLTTRCSSPLVQVSTISCLNCCRLKVPLRCRVTLAPLHLARQAACRDSQDSRHNSRLHEMLC
jgi:hypothetical protein